MLPGAPVTNVFAPLLARCQTDGTPGSSMIPISNHAKTQDARRARAWAGVALLIASACGEGEGPPVALCTAEPTDDPDVPVLSPEDADAFAGVGYVTHDAGDAYGNPSCGATLVHRRVVVTAAHCIERALATPSARIGFGLGPICHRVVPVVATIPFSEERDYGEPGREEWDLAALVLASGVDDAAPIAIGSATIACDATSVGYGRKVAGPSDLREGYDGARRVLPMCVDALSAGVHAHSVGDASPCFGDSGSPLLGADGALLGVLTSFEPALEDVRCTPGEGLVYVDAAAHQAFLAQVIADVEAGAYP